MIQCIICLGRREQPKDWNDEAFCLMCERFTRHKTWSKPEPEPKKKKATARPNPLERFDGMPTWLKNPQRRAPMNAKSDENVRTTETDAIGTETVIAIKRKNEMGDEFDVEHPHRLTCPFTFDHFDATTSVMGYVDWLQENGCKDEAELMGLDWGMKIGSVPPSADVVKRITELRKRFGVKDKKLVHERVPGNRGREQMITLFLENPMGVGFYMKATINQLHMENEKFKRVLHENPITHIHLACNATKSPALTAKLLGWKLLAKCETLELNNLEIGLVELREMFNGSEMMPKHLILTAREKTKITKDQVMLLPQLQPKLQYLETLDYHGLKYDYRFPADQQPV